jgi:hypothetical protein
MNRMRVSENISKAPMTVDSDSDLASLLSDYALAEPRSTFRSGAIWHFSLWGYNAQLAGVEDWGVRVAKHGGHRRML